MHRLLTALVFSVIGCGGAIAQQASLAPVMELIRADEWDSAYVEARRVSPVARDIVQWRQLRAGEGVLGDYLGFLSRNDDWPGLDKVRLQGEATLSAHSRAKDVFALFDGHPPQTANGAYHLARAHRQNNDGTSADQILTQAWQTLPMTKGEVALLLSRHGDLLRPYNNARMDMLLWSGRTESAENFLAEVSADWRKLATARIALRSDRPGVDGLINAVPAALADDPGLAYERFLWRTRKGRHDAALELLQHQSRSAETLGRPDHWSGQRRHYARRLMRDGKAQAAYRLASSHYLDGGSAYADLEWLSGYLALRQLNDPQSALKHFRRFRAAVFTPISLGRAGYWEGLAQEALGNHAEAQAAFAFGAEYQTSFYGLLSAEKAGLPFDRQLTATETFPDWTQADFLQNPVMQAAILFQQAGELNLAEWFLVHLSESLDRSQLGQLSDLVLALEEPHLAVRIGKQAAKQGHVLIHSYYPDHPLAREILPAIPELALAIARRESEFDAGVTSPAGARGLMQLMPATARSMAKFLGEEYKPNALLSDWRYNARLGAAYLDHLTDEFGHSYVLVAAAYNAGPSRVHHWIEQFGDPRRDNIDPVDWIEHIPFNETRNYVMRVMESLPVYRARLSGKVSPVRLSQELRSTPAGL